MTGPLPPPRPTVYGAARRAPHPLVLVALGVLIVGVLTGIVLALQALGASEDQVATPVAASGPPGSPLPASRPPASSANAEPSPSSPPSSSPPSAGSQQVAGVQGQGSGLCLDVQPDQPTAGGLLLLAPCAHTPSQRWQVRADGMVVNGATGLCLTVAGAATTDSARVQQEACQGAAHQQWRLFVGPDGSVTFGAVHSGKCLDVTGGGTAPGTPVQQFTCNDTPAQRWLLQPE